MTNKHPTLCATTLAPHTDILFGFGVTPISWETIRDTRDQTWVGPCKSAPCGLCYGSGPWVRFLTGLQPTVPRGLCVIMGLLFASRPSLPFSPSTENRPLVRRKYHSGFWRPLPVRVPSPCPEMSVFYLGSSEPASQ